MWYEIAEERKIIPHFRFMAKDLPPTSCGFFVVVVNYCNGVNGDIYKCSYNIS
jgi:hypothetical protein